MAAGSSSPNGDLVSEVQTISARLAEADLRVERIVHLDTMAMTGALHRELAEWLMSDCKHLLFEAFRWDLADMGPDRDVLEEALAWAPHGGWILEVATPVKKRLSNGGVIHSWGFTESKAFYSATYEQALEQAFAWVDTREPEDG
jgi:hypothetical protein